MNAKICCPKTLVELNCCGIPSGKRTLLKDFSFTWCAGEHWGIIGPNGSGKSIFMRLIAGDIYSRNCEVTLHFRGASGGGPERRIATVSMERQAELLESFEAYAQMRWNSIEEESTPTLGDWLSQDSIEGLTAYEVKSRSKSSVAAFRHCHNVTLAKMELNHLVTRRIAELSNGEMRRALIAYALLSKPKLLLLDSPFVGLDAESRTIVARSIHEIADAGQVQTMFASVRPEELPPSTTHLLEFNAAGKVVEMGPLARKKNKKSKIAKTNSPAETRHEPASFKISGTCDPEAEPLVEMNNITINYGDHVVISNLTWTVRKGERWLLTGPNGSGKTTLISLIIGDHLQAYSNNIRVFGKSRGNGQSIWEIKKSIGWVSPELHACMDVSQSILSIVLSGFTDTASGPDVQSKSRKEEAMKILTKLKLSKHADARFGLLSSGEQRLVLLARALVKKPPMLILDEPCQNLDTQNRKRFLDILDSTWVGKTITLLYITHLEDATPRCITNTIKATLA